MLVWQEIDEEAVHESIHQSILVCYKYVISAANWRSVPPILGTVGVRNGVSSTLDNHLIKRNTFNYRPIMLRMRHELTLEDKDLGFIHEVNAKTILSSFEI
jgi:hypothetical protein